jgi:putative nucleotidyltransferase with HDIG domain
MDQDGRAFWRPSCPMKPQDTTPTLDVRDLRIGHFVHLDGGWWSHPFPLSSFKITSDAQIATIRSLGVPRVRYSPERSDFVATAAGRLDGVATTTGSATLQETAPTSRPAEPGPADAPAGPAPTSAPAPTPARIDAAAVRRAQVAAERAALRLCERQFAEASQACKQVFALVPSKAEEAGRQSQALSRALVDKLLQPGEMCVRLLTEAAGDKVSMHAINVTVIALLMGRALGLAEAEMLDLGQGALLHDLGKLDLPDRVKHREDHFSAHEVSLYQEHVAKGVAHARKMLVPTGAQLVIAQHHEHADGSGFPARLGVDRMTAAARIVALVNRYDNLCNPHVPTRAITPHEAMSLLFAEGNAAHGPRRFDTAILGAFIKMMGVYPPGSLVQLTDDRYAMVVAVNSSRPLKPRVLVHTPGERHEEALVLNLETEPRLGVRRSLKADQLPRAALDFLSPRPRMTYFFEPVRTAQDEALAEAA